MAKKKPNEPTKVSIIRQHYPTLTAREIADKFNISLGYVCEVARLKHLQHDPDTALRSKEHRASAISKSRRHTYAMEKLRIEMGEPQRTKMKVGGLSKSQHWATCNLVRKHGYYRSDDPLTLFYDENTHRCPGGRPLYTEEYYNKRYGIHFIPDYKTHKL